MELIFETMETEEIYTNTYHSMIEPIVNRNFGNTFHHQNGPNQIQQTKKIPVSNNNTSPLDNSISTETLTKNINIDILANSINPYPSKEI